MKKNNQKSLLALVLTALLLTIAVSGTLAYLSDKTSAVTNTFSPAYVTCKVVEPDWKPGNPTKRNVTIQNTGNISAYIRVAIAANWCNEQGQIIAAYGEDIPVGDDWKYNTVDGYYYHIDPVPAGKETSVLIESFTPEGGPDGAHLEMTIIAQAIQSEGSAVNVGADGGWTIKDVN